jgi:hypothetical protein
MFLYKEHVCYHKTYTYIDDDTITALHQISSISMENERWSEQTTIEKKEIKL